MEGLAGAKIGTPRELAPCSAEADPESITRSRKLASFSGCLTNRGLTGRFTLEKSRRLSA